MAPGEQRKPKIDPCVVDLLCQMQSAGEKLAYERQKQELDILQAHPPESKKPHPKPNQQDFDWHQKKRRNRAIDKRRGAQ